MASSNYIDDIFTRTKQNHLPPPPQSEIPPRFDVAYKIYCAIIRGFLGYIGNRGKPKLYESCERGGGRSKGGEKFVILHLKCLKKILSIPPPQKNVNPFDYNSLSWFADGLNVYKHKIEKSKLPKQGGGLQTYKFNYLNNSSAIFLLLFISRAVLQTSYL